MSSNDYWFEKAEKYENVLQEIANNLSFTPGTSHDLLLDISDIVGEVGFVVTGKYANGLKENENEA